MKEPTRRERRLADELVRAAAGCPPARELSAYHDRTASDADRQAIESHLAGCPPCRAAVEFLDSGALQPEDEAAPLPDSVLGGLERTMAAVSAAPGRATSSPGSRSGWMKLAAGFFLLASLAIAGYLVWPPSGPDEDLGAFRGPAGVEALAPAGKLAAPPPELRWNGLPGAREYRVILFDADLDEIWSGAAGEAFSIALPPEALARLRRGGRFSWEVVALDGTGAELARSPVTPFEIEAAPPTR